MFAFNLRREIVVRILLIIAILFNAPMSSFSAHAAEETGTPAPTITDTPTTEPTLTPTEATPPVTETPVPLTETPSPSEIPIETVPSDITGEAQQSAASSTPALLLSVDPNFIAPSGIFTLIWRVEGVARDGLVMQILLPAGVLPHGDYEYTYDEDNHTVSINLNSLNGEIEIKTDTPDLPVALEATLLRNSEQLASTSIYLPVHEQFVMDRRGGEISAMGGKLKLSFPPDALSERAVIEIGDPAEDAVPPYSLSGKPFEIKAHAQQSNAELNHFAKELSIFVSYADLEIPEGQEEDLALFWYNPETGSWEQLSSTVDTQTKTLEAFTDHFTVFDMDVNNWQADHIPTIDSFQVSNFTGAATYSLPIEVPAGPGGFQPSIELNYNSQIVDQSTTQSQASWVGMGWSLDTGSIELDSHGTSWPGDDTFLLNVAGVSTRLLPYGGTYHATDENFWKIVYNTSTKSWTIQDKQGNTYYFEHVINYPFQTGSCSPNPPDAEVNWKDYRWMVSRKRNIFGQEIVYTYTDQTTTVRLRQSYSQSGDCNTVDVTSISASYPSTITYANNKYRIR
jgi:hypothetical protein